MNVVHNLPLSFPFPLQILSHVSTGSIILWKGSGWGIWVLLQVKGQQSCSSVNVAKELRICVLSNIPCFSSCLSSLTQIMASLMSQQRKIPPLCSVMSHNNTDTPVCLSPCFIFSPSAIDLKTTNVEKEQVA